LTPSRVGGSKSHILSPQNMSGGQKSLYKRMQGAPSLTHGNQSHTDSHVNNERHNDRLNLSVDIVGRHGSHNSNAANQLSINNQANRKQYKNVRDYGVRMSGITDEQRKAGVETSLHEMSHHKHSKSLMGQSALDDFSNSQQANILDKKKELLEKKRYEQLHKNYNQQTKHA
jgi:hypothetical protein